MATSDRRSPVRSDSASNRHRTAHLEMSAQDRRRERVAIQRGAGTSRGGIQRAAASSVAPGQSDSIPAARSMGAQKTSPSLLTETARPSLDKLIEPDGPLRDSPGHHQRDQQIVELIVIAKIGCGPSARTPRDGSGSSAREVARLHRKPRRNVIGATVRRFLERARRSRNVYGLRSRSRCASGRRLDRVTESDSPLPFARCGGPARRNESTSITSCRQSLHRLM